MSKTHKFIIVVLFLFISTVIESMVVIISKQKQKAPSLPTKPTTTGSFLLTRPTTIDLSLSAPLTTPQKPSQSSCWNTILLACHCFLYTIRVADRIPGCYLTDQRSHQKQD